MEEKIKRGMAKWLKKDNLLILLLAGVLLVVIALPTEKSSPGERTDTGLTAGNQESAVQSIMQADSGFSGAEEYAAYLESRLEDTLSQISGVGAVQVMITLNATQELVLEKDQQTQSSSTTEEDSQGGNRTSHQISRSEDTVYHSSGNNEPFVVKTLLPRVEGVVVVAQGAGDPQVRLALNEAVSALTGLRADKISICKGK